ncbi:amidohydrolase family protein [Flavivirga aquimarina]|uniref:Amidohydrolase family protein n=1 Tax=Flavivirga aquimarina TaxID=2027862 RepID=A0ABT8WEJ8_9FLAO|nr:amidohydrolase family protein [Flavivirga aquimarina]MDO5971427.1 amidohydrolase family protein [Flavivirga aquimarina]
MSKKIINAHTHVFTSQFVPPFLAKTIVPWPLYFLIHTQWIVGLAKRYYRYKHGLKFPNKSTTDKGWDALYKRRRKKRTHTRLYYNIKSRVYLYIPYRLIIFWLSLVATIYAVEWLAGIIGLNPDTSKIIKDVKDELAKYHLYFELNEWIKLLWVTTVVIFINWSRRAIWFVIKSLFPFFNKIASSKGMELLERYLLMGRFALYGSQKDVAQRALHQLPPGSEMIILPMDMEYMGAGKTKLRRDLLKSKDEKLKDGWDHSDFGDTYKYQMRELWEFVKTRRESGSAEQYHPFLFVDPRRVEKEGTAFFDYELVNNRMKLKPCFVKTYIEEREFSGFKIYPALGYYVFDEHLLPIWRYASENNIPIMTHCVIGVIYYRGRKQKSWNYHPVFKQHYRDKRSHLAEPMLLPQTKNVDMQFNFTHPMNYLCVYEEGLLKEVLKGAKKDATRELFGYKDDATPLAYNLNNLKICLAHYGGEEAWTKFLESDRDVYSRSIIKKPDEGIIFMKNSEGKFSESKINSLWHDTDWYAIITSMLMQYENMYADLSYIISKPSIYPLLNLTLQKGKDYEEQYKNYEAEPSPNKKASHLKGRNRLRSHILYGTDFYVVRNHNSDKDLFVETKAAISEESFDLIARENTFNYLSRN